MLVHAAALAAAALVPLVALASRDNPFIWQVVVEYESVSERKYVAGSSLKQYSQDFQTVVLHNDLYGYSERLLLDLGDGCTDMATLDALGSSLALPGSIPSIALIERGGSCDLWSRKINNTLALSLQHNFNIAAALIVDNTTYDDVHIVSLSTTDDKPPVWNTPLPSNRNISNMPDNDLGPPTTFAAVYFVPSLYGNQLKAMIRSNSNDTRRYIQLRMFFDEATLPDNSTDDGTGVGGNQPAGDGKDTWNSFTNDRGYLAYVIAAAATLVFGVVCLKWCRKTRPDQASREISLETASAFGRLSALPQQQQETRRMSITVLNSLCPAQELGKAETKNSACAVCLEELKSDDIVRILPCGHGFCVACIDVWLTKKSSVCPICKYNCNPHQPDSSENSAGNPSSPPLPAPSEATELQDVHITRPAPAAVLPLPS